MKSRSVVLAFLLLLGIAVCAGQAEISDAKPRFGVMMGALSETKDVPYAIDTIPMPFPVAALDFFDDGGAVLLSKDGKLALLEGAGNPPWEEATSGAAFMWEVIAEGLKEPRGVRVLGETLYVAAGHRLSRVTATVTGLVRHWEVKTLCEFPEETVASNLESDGEGRLLVGVSKEGSVKGRLLRVDAKTGVYEELAGGYITGGTLALAANGGLATAVNEGENGRLDWTVHPGLDVKGEGADAFRLRPSLVCHFPSDAHFSPIVLVVPDHPAWRSWKNELLVVNPSSHSGVIGVMQQLVSVAGRPDCCDRSPQGSVVEIIPELGSGVSAARFSPLDQQLYVAGGDLAKEGSWLKRIRATGVPPKSVFAVKVARDGIEVKFICTLDTQSAADRDHWKLFKTDHATGSQPSMLAIESATPGTDDQSVFLESKEIRVGLEYVLKYDTRSADGAVLAGQIEGTVRGFSE